MVASRLVIHLLEIPEILRAIVQHLIHFESSGALVSPFLFRPRALLDCCMVSKRWRQVLLPVLWRVYDQRYMWMVLFVVLIRNSASLQFYHGEDIFEQNDRALAVKTRTTTTTTTTSKAALNNNKNTSAQPKPPLRAHR
ncbi:hypothetical protein BGX23_007647, partial [Mortierella sp. AD031]